MTMTITRKLAVVSLALLLAGCSPSAPVASDGAATEDSVDGGSEASTYGGFAIDPPESDEVVLTIEGSVEVDFTYAELQSLAIVEITIVEPFVNERQSFTGVPLVDLLNRASVPDDARIETIALNDYRYADAVASWVDSGALLAVYRDGELIPMDQGGPIRIVFAETSSSFDVLDAWNWSLRTIIVVK